MKERKILLIVILTIFSFLVYIENISAAGKKDKYIEKSGNFSISIPEEWEVITVKGLKYSILRGKFINNFAPTINFSDDTFNGQFDDYIESVHEELEKIFGENIEYILQSEFVTSKGLIGRILVITTFQQEMLIQQSFFCFPAKNDRMLIITCTNLASEFEKYNILFNETVKTFEWTRN